ncbi:hypothetical protein IG631_22351 [Alternaria alternata]|nr:hypothetical protein IG631_22351 [Alternaria alternata]
MRCSDKSARCIPLKIDDWVRLLPWSAYCGLGTPQAKNNTHHHAVKTAYSLVKYRVDILPH